MSIIYINFAHVTPGQIVCMLFNPCTEEPVTSISIKKKERRKKKQQQPQLESIKHHQAHYMTHYHLLTEHFL